MSIFDKMFKKNALDRKMDDAFDMIAENNPVMKRAKAAIEDGKDQITRSLEREVIRATGERPENHPDPRGDDDALMKEWDAMFDQIFEGKLDSVKICPSCGEAASAKLNRCPRCGAPLPEMTAKEQLGDELEDWK